MIRSKDQTGIRLYLYRGTIRGDRTGRKAHESERDELKGKASLGQVRRVVWHCEAGWMDGSIMKLLVRRTGSGNLGSGNQAQKHKPGKQIQVVRFQRAGNIKHKG